jgi:hypothetical protein
MYGVAGHGKSEVDSVGGVVKIAIRNDVARGACFLDAGECVDFLHDKFQGSVDPMYSIKEIDPASLEIMRKENRYMVFPTIDGSSSFQVLIFTPNSNKFKASPYLCTCEICINIEYGSCSLFQVYELTAVDLIKRTMRSDFEPAQTSSSDVSEEENIFANGFFSPESICAIAADESSFETLFFVRILENDCISNQFEIDDFHHKVSPGQAFLKCHYLEKHSETKKGYVYTENTKKIVYIYREAIVYPFVCFDNRNDKKLFISMQHFCDIMYYVENAGMASLF